jgi:hypothetical protein
MDYEWVETLPVSCPPVAAAAPEGDYFRVVSAFPPQVSDFNSTRQENLEKVFNVDECLVCSCSIFSKYSECEKLLKLPRRRNKRIVGIHLSSDSGLVLRTFERPFHYSWWRDRRFPIAQHVYKAGGE